MDRQRRWFPFWLWILSLLWIFSSLLGCSGVGASTSPLSTPFLIPTGEDATRLAKLTHELDTKASQCLAVANCEQMYFARGLVSLFENQEAARAAFRHVIDHNPASPLATSSELWLRLIGDGDGAGTPQSHPSIAIVAQFVRDWMERQLAEHSKDEKPPPLTGIQDVVADQSRVVQVLQKQIRDRDRQIAILQFQLEALKLIDQDHLDKQRKIKPPASLIPTAEYLR